MAFCQQYLLAQRSRSLLRRFLQTQARLCVLDRAGKRNAHLTRLTLRSRCRRGLYMADVALSAPLRYQQDLLTYRLGHFALGYHCVCNASKRFSRGYEDRYLSFRHLAAISRSQRQEKLLVARELHLDLDKRFTNLDFLLNTARLCRAGLALASIRGELRRIYRERKIVQQSCDTTSSLRSLPVSRISDVAGSPLAPALGPDISTAAGR